MGDISLKVDIMTSCKICGMIYSDHMMGKPEIRRHLLTEHGLQNDILQKAKEKGFNENNELETICPFSECDWSEKGIRRSSFIKHLGIFHKECKEKPPTPPPPQVISPEPPRKKMS